MERLVLITLVMIAFVGYSEIAAPDETANLQTRDEIAVLELVLDDLTKYDKPDLPFSIGRGVPRNIYVSRSTMRYQIHTKTAEKDFIVELPNALGPLTHANVLTAITEEEQSAIRHAIANMGERHRFETFEQDFGLKNAAIHMVDKQDGGGINGAMIPYGARFPVQVCPPGYSGDGRCAVVHLYFTDIFHPSYATYVLVLEREKWTIKYRAFVTYA